MSNAPHGATTVHGSKGGAPHGASTIHPSKGGGAKWLLGAVAAAVVIGGGYLAWTNLGPSQGSPQTAYDDPYATDPSEPGQDVTVQSAMADESAAPAAAEAATAARPARRSTASAAAVPEETIGITPISATTQDTVQASAANATDSDEIVVTARRPIWVRQPSARRLSALYPERALARGRSGEARLHCLVQAGGALNCERISETPGGGFGVAAMRVAHTLRHAPTLSDGSDATGSPVNLHVVFRMGDDARRG